MARPYQEILDILDGQRVRCWLGGGWAEELQGIVPPRNHKDVDLYLPAATFSSLDRYMPDPREGTIKHFRGFVLCGALVEVLLMRPTETGYVTSFFDRYDLVWPERSLHEQNGVRMLTPSALEVSRTAFPEMCAARAAYEASLEGLGTRRPGSSGVVA